MALSLITAPSVLPVSLVELKAHLKVDTTDFDDELTLKLKSAVKHVEEVTRRALLTQTWRLSLDTFPKQIELPKGRTQSVTMTYLNTSGVRTSFTDFVVSAGREPAIVVPAWSSEWPDFREFLESVQVSFVCGWTAAADVPADIKSAVLLYAGWLWLGPETDQVLGGTQTSRGRTFDGLVANWVLRSDEVADLVAV